MFSKQIQFCTAILFAMFYFFGGIVNADPCDGSPLIRIHNIIPQSPHQIWLTDLRAKMSTDINSPCDHLSISMEMPFYAPPQMPQLWAFDNQDTCVTSSMINYFVKVTNATCMQLEFVYNNHTYVAGPFKLTSDPITQLYASALPNTFNIDFGQTPFN